MQIHTVCSSLLRWGGETSPLAQGLIYEGVSDAPLQVRVYNLESVTGCLHNYTAVHYVELYILFFLVRLIFGHLFHAIHSGI